MYELRPCATNDAKNAVASAPPSSAANRAIARSDKPPAITGPDRTAPSGRITRQDRAQVDPLPPPATPAPLDPPIAPIAGDTLAWVLPELEAFAATLEVGVTFQALDGGCDGLYRVRERQIAINTGVSVNQQAAAFVHELAHALVHLDHHDEDPQLDYATEELVAESVALCVCGFLGLDTASNSIPYLAFWSEDTEPNAFERIAGLVDRLARRLEDSLDADTDVPTCEAAAAEGEQGQGT